MTEEVTQIVFEPPGRDEPGFLRRSKRALQLAIQLKDFQTLDMETVTVEKLDIFDDMVEFLVPFVKKPADRKEAEEALWNASESQFSQMLAAVQGQESNNGVNPTKKAATGKRGKRSGSTSKA